MEEGENTTFENKPTGNFFAQDVKTANKELESRAKVGTKGDYQQLFF